MFFAAYISLACLVSGAAVPAGVFVPSLLSGAAFGRFLGHLLHKLDYSRGTFADAGTYALMGAAACTGGITRITISLVIMILEATGDMQYVLPLMLSVMAARFVGNLFTEGLYDMKISSRGLPFLEEEDQLADNEFLYKLTVADVMTPTPICLEPIVQVGPLLDMLLGNQHNCFPVGKRTDSLCFINDIIISSRCDFLIYFHVTSS